MRCEGLSLAIAGRALCRDLRFEVRAGECWALLGPNGAGKTTLLSTLAGFLRPETGRILLHERPLGEWPRRELARYRAFLPQQLHDEFGGTVLETALTGRHPHLARWQWESSADEAIAEAALATMDVLPAIAAARDVRTLSGGERQRVALAAVLAQDAELLLLDEPTAHLDLRHQLQLAATLSDLARRRGKAMVVALHDVNLALRFCDHALLIRDGEARAGHSYEMLTAEQLSWLYGQPMQAVRLPQGVFFLPA
jgi:iron complex transport system ATP-binding protein